MGEYLPGPPLIERLVVVTGLGTRRCGATQCHIRRRVAGQAGQRRAEAAGVAARPAAEELQELGNSGIAAALVLTLGTVEKHVASIFGKLGLPASESDNQRVLAVLRYLGP